MNEDDFQAEWDGPDKYNDNDIFLEDENGRVIKTVFPFMPVQFCWYADSKEKRIVEKKDLKTFKRSTKQEYLIERKMLQYNFN